MRKISFFDTLGNFGTDILVIVTGILFLTHRYTGWSILYIFAVVICAALPIRLLLNIRSGIRSLNSATILLVVFDIVFLFTILVQPENFVRWFHVFFGWWMFGRGFISLVEFHVLIHDQLPGAYPRFFIGIFSILLSLFMILSHNLSIKTDVLSVFAGICFLMYGILGALFHLSIFRRQAHPELPSWSYSPPILLNAFFPLELYISLRQLQKSSRLSGEKDPQDADLKVFIHMKGKGPEAFGHIDISYKGTVISYGNHDPESRHLVGTYGDGVMLWVDEEKFLRQCINVEGKTIVGYGIRLDDRQKAVLEEHIKELLSRAVPWKSAAQRADEAGQDITPYKDYASRVYKNTGGQMYKFTRGKFRTDFISSTNCVLLADELIRNKDLSLVYLSGLVTPGAYLSFLNSEYLKPNTPVISRTLYETIPSKPSELKVKQL